VKVFFIGNRTPVFDAAQALGLKIIKTLAVPNSFLSRKLAGTSFEFSELSNPQMLIEEIGDTEFDLLISNGCPHLLPVTTLRKKWQTFINVHPSLLPDLKGRNPVNGALLFDRPLGATCHIMDDGVDTGPAISSVPIEIDEGLDLGLAYQLAFLAEADAFKMAFQRNFEPLKANPNLGIDPVYFTRKELDLFVNWHENIGQIIRRVSAFSVPGQLARFQVDGKLFTAARAEKVSSAYIQSKFKDHPNHSIVLAYDQSLLIKLPDGYIKFSGLEGDMRSIACGDIIHG
jgi:methionyl-tRNA formyltransferase